MPRTKTLCSPRTNACAALAACVLSSIAGTSQAQTDVPAGGLEIEIGAGSSQLRLRLRNTTETTARDLTLAIYSDQADWVPDFQTIDITGVTERIDDNGNGTLERDEDDNDHDGGNKRIAKTIFTDTNVDDGGEITVLIQLSQATEDGTHIRVKFSEVLAGDDGVERHWDINAAVFVEPFIDEYFIDMTPGAAQACSDLYNLSDQPIYALIVPIWPENPIVDIQLPPLYDHSMVIPEPDAWIIELDPPVLPGQQLDLFYETEFPIYDPWNSFVQPIIVIPEPPRCRADINEDGVVNTLDYLEFLNLFNARDPFADWNNDGVINTLDFLAFQNDWTDCR